jgi:hypothetical protein
VFRNSTRYNKSIETHAAALAPSSVGVKEFALRYMCNFSYSDSRIALLTSSMSVFLGAGDLDRWFGLILLSYNLLLAASYGMES